MFVQICCGCLFKRQGGFTDVVCSKDKVGLFINGVLGDAVRGESKSHRKLGEPPIRLLSGENICDPMLHHVAERIRLIQIFWQVASGENMADALVGQDLVETAERRLGQAVGAVPGSELVFAAVSLRFTEKGVSQVTELFLCPDANLSVSAVLVSIWPREHDAAVVSCSLHNPHLLANVLLVGDPFKKEGGARNIPFILAIRFEWVR